MIIEHFLDWVETAPVHRRAEATVLLARSFLVSELDTEDIESAEAAMTLLLDDPSPDVRIALAETLAASPMAPRHIVSALADDAEEISEIILSQSPVFVDAELIDKVATGTQRQKMAIASRSLIGVGVVGAIAEVGELLPCMRLLENQNAKCTPRVLHRMAQRFGGVPELREKLLVAEGLGADTRLLLIEKLGQSLQGFVTKKSWLSSVAAESVVREACDKASINFAANTSENDLDSVVESLIEGGRISTSFLLRAVCMGNISLVASAMSQLASVSGDRVEAMLINGRRAAFKAVFTKAGLPEPTFEVFYSAIDTWRELLATETQVHRSKLPYLVTRRVLANYNKMETGVVDDLLVLLRRLAADAARTSARSRVSDLKDRNSARRLAATAITDDQLTAAFVEEFSGAFDEELETVLDDGNLVIANDVEDGEILETLAADQQKEEIRITELAEVEQPVLDPVAPVILDVHTGREIPLQIAA